MTPFPLRTLSIHRWSVSVPARCFQHTQVSCAELSEADTQYFAVIANGEFIKTNALPTTPEPSTWLDLVDQAASSILTWTFGVSLALGIAACCAISCACRRCQRNRRHKVLQSRYRRAITTNRGIAANGRKIRPPASRPLPYPGPVRAPGDSHAAAEPGRFEESWRRPGPGSISGRSMRSMRSERSARGALLTGAGAVVPVGVVPECTSPTSPHETCPECGLCLPDVVQLVSHVEIQHGGRATRRREAAAAAAAAAGLEGGTAKGVVVMSSSKDSKKSPPATVRQTSAESRATAASSRASSRPGSKSPGARNAFAPGARNAFAPNALVPAVRSTAAAATAVSATAAVATSRARGKSPGPGSKPRSRSPVASGRSGSGRTSSGHSGSSSSTKTGSSSPDSSGRRSTAEASRDALPRVKDASGHGTDFIPRILPRAEDFSGHGKAGRRPAPAAEPAYRGADARTTSVSLTAAAAAASRLPSTNPDRRRRSREDEQGRRRSRSPGAMRGDARRDRNGSGSGSSRERSGASMERSRHSADKGKSSNESSRDRDRGRGRERVREVEAVPKREKPSGHLPREDSARSLTRTASLDRLSALSSRAITRSSGKSSNNAGGGGGGDGGGYETGGAREGVLGRAAAVNEPGGGNNRIRRTASTEDMVPTAERLTADTLRTLGSGLPVGYALPPPVFSPVMSPSARAKEPAYSPVARARARELDNDRPVGLTRKFFRQLSGDA